VEVRIIKKHDEFDEGRVYDLPPHQARQLIAEGYAVLSLVRSFLVEDGRSKQKSERAVTI
jgi:hypothetical protein